MVVSSGTLVRGIRIKRRRLHLIEPILHGWITEVVEELAAMHPQYVLQRLV